MPEVREHKRNLTSSIRNRLAIIADDVVVKKGVYKARKGFYYRMNGTAESFRERVKATIPEATIINYGEHWMPFRGGASLGNQSHWWVEFTV